MRARLFPRFQLGPGRAAPECAQAAARYVQCIAEGLNKPVVPSVCSSTNCVRCSAAEIMISTFTKQDEADHSGARVMPIELSSAKALGTNGITEEGGTFKYVELHYANDICWYLDQTFCSFFFNAEIAGVDVEKLMVSLFVIIEFSSCMILITFLLLLARSFFNTLLITWCGRGLPNSVPCATHWLTTDWPAGFLPCSQGHRQRRFCRGE